MHIHTQNLPVHLLGFGLIVRGRCLILRPGKSGWDRVSGRILPHNWSHLWRVGTLCNRVSYSICQLWCQLNNWCCCSVILRQLQWYSNRLAAQCIELLFVIVVALPKFWQDRSTYAVTPGWYQSHWALFYWVCLTRSMVSDRPGSRVLLGLGQLLSTRNDLGQSSAAVAAALPEY